MAERIPDPMGERAHERYHAARLGFVPNSVLFERLRGFYRSPATIQRLGRQGLVLFSIQAIPVVRYPRLSTEWESGPQPITMPEVDRIDTELRRLTGNDQHMPMGETLGFAPLPGNGIAIHMNVQLHGPALDKLQGTPFIDEDGVSVPVRLQLAGGEHAPGVEMQKAARRLEESLRPGRYPQPGTEALDIRIR